mgnify:FL=1
MVDNLLVKVSAEMDDLFSKYRLSEALMLVYKLFWDEFSSWYLEMVKPAYGQPIDKKTYESTLHFFDVSVASASSVYAIHYRRIVAAYLRSQTGRKYHGCSAGNFLWS